MQKVVGGLLLAAGTLIAGLSGLCTLFMFAESSSPETYSYESIMLVLIFGGIPFGVGALLIFAGYRLVRRAD